MNANEIDRALREDRGIAPSPAFASRVMGAVRRQAEDREAIAFPWLRLLPGLVASVAIAGASVVFAPPPEVPQTVVRALENPAVVQAATWVPMALLGTWLATWLPLRLTGYSR
jgi:hypothetical protein